MDHIGEAQKILPKKYHNLLDSLCWFHPDPVEGIDQLRGMLYNLWSDGDSCSARRKDIGEARHKESERLMNELSDYLEHHFPGRFYMGG